MQEIVQEDLVARAVAAEKKKKRARTGVKWDRLFMACAYNWYWFVLSMIVCSCIADLYAKSQPQFYVAKSSILIRSKDSAQGTPSMTFSDLGLSTVNYIPNEPHKLKSSRVMEVVVNSLGLNVQYFGHMFLRDVNIYKNTPVQVTPLKEVTSGYTITIVPKSAEEFEFKVGQGGAFGYHLVEMQDESPQGAVCGQREQPDVDGKGSLVSNDGRTCRRPQRRDQPGHQGHQRRDVCRHSQRPGCSL